MEGQANTPRDTNGGNGNGILRLKSDVPKFRIMVAKQLRASRYHDYIARGDDPATAALLADGAEFSFSQETKVPDIPEAYY